MIWSGELTITIDFYTQTLGFTCVEYNEEWGWAALHRDGVEITAARPNEHTPFERPLFTGSFYINTDSVDELRQELKDKTQVCYPLEGFYYGMREFAIYDNYGYLLQLGQEIGRRDEAGTSRKGSFQAIPDRRASVVNQTLNDLTLRPYETRLALLP